MTGEMCNFLEKITDLLINKLTPQISLKSYNSLIFGDLFSIKGWCFDTVRKVYGGYVISTSF